MKKLTTLLAGLAFFLCSYAQNSIQHADLSVETMFIDSAQTPLMKHKPSILVDLSDTSSISQIEITLFNAANNTQILSRTFSYNTLGEFNDGTEYSRNGDILIFALGQYNLIRNYTATFRLKYANGQYGDYQNLTSN